MALRGSSPMSIMFRTCDSDETWHLKPFSSRICREQAWQYQRRRCRPLLFIWLEICFVEPISARGMVAVCLGTLGGKAKYGMLRMEGTDLRACGLFQERFVQQWKSEGEMA